LEFLNSAIALEFGYTCQFALLKSSAKAVLCLLHSSGNLSSSPKFKRDLGRKLGLKGEKGQQQGQ